MSDRLAWSRTYLIDSKGNKIYFDTTEDTSSSKSSDVADTPIDARRGTTLQDKKTVDMETLGVSGRYTNRSTNNPSFKNSENRIASVISYYETSLKRSEIYTVCKKGVVYENMMLNGLDIDCGDSICSVSITLSFIETNIIEIDYTNPFIAPVKAIVDKVSEVVNKLSSAISKLFHKDKEE